MNVANLLIELALFERELHETVGLTKKWQGSQKIIIFDENFCFEDHALLEILNSRPRNYLRAPNINFNRTKNILL